MAKLSIVVVLVCSLLCVSHIVHAQATPNCFCDASHWVLKDSLYVHTHNGYGRFNKFQPYFINERIGFVFMSRRSQNTYGVIHGPLYRTKDGGDTWERCDSNSFKGCVAELYFETVAHGFAAICPPKGTLDPSGGGIFETLDTGYTWHKILARDSILFTNIRASGSYIVAIGDGGLLFIESFDGGKSWRDPMIANRNGGYYSFYGLYGDREKFIAAESGVIGATTDAGFSWSIYPNPLGTPVEPLWPYCIPHRSMIFNQGGYNPGFVLRTNDLNSKWDTVLRNFDYPLQNAIQGSGCVVYIDAVGPIVHEAPKDNPTNAGIFARSTDLGASWTIVSGPPHGLAGVEEATPYAVVGNGAVIYSISTFGYVWKSTDGGDGTLSSNPYSVITTGHMLPMQSASDTLVTTLCDSTSFGVWLQYLASCNYGALSSVSIDGLQGVANYSTTLTSHVGSLKLPDTARISIVPHAAGTYPISVHAIYTDDDFVSGDTSFALTLVVRPNPGVLSIAAKSAIDFGAQAL